MVPTPVHFFPHSTGPALKPGSAAAVLPGVHALALTLTLAWLQSPGPKELGLVTWGRNYQEALQAAQGSGRPLLILFDEVPGCSTCVHYGEVVLSDALLVEAAETLFVPLAIYNNQGGEDRRVLELFQEPAWNNPVVQFVAADGRRLIPRLAGDYSTSGLAAAMIAALRTAQRPVPEWLAIYAAALRAESAPRRTELRAMGCFWSGEACLARAPGVISTRTGFVEGHEVVEVQYAEAEIDRAALEACGTQLRGNFVPSPKDQLYHLRRSRWAKLPLNPAQARRVNAALSASEDPRPFLSPRQLASTER